MVLIFPRNYFAHLFYLLGSSIVNFDDIVDTPTDNLIRSIIEGNSGHLISEIKDKIFCKKIFKDFMKKIHFQIRKSSWIYKSYFFIFTCISRNRYVPFFVYPIIWWYNHQMPKQLTALLGELDGKHLQYRDDLNNIYFTFFYLEFFLVYFVIWHNEVRISKMTYII